jgi:hypothetical protein
MDDLVRDLQQVQRYAAALEGVLAAARAKVPQRAQGADSARAIRVVLDGAGLPAEIVVAADWQRRVPPARLGPAVSDAANKATEARVSEWGKALDGGWSREIDELRAAQAGRRPAVTDPPVPAPALAPAPPAAGPDRPRPTDEIFEDALRAVDASLAYAQRAATVQEVTGENRDGTVRVSLSRAGLVSCTVNGGWAAGKSGPVVTAAIREALAAARTRMPAADREPAGVGEIDALFGEVMGLLNSARRTAGS